MSSNTITIIEDNAGRIHMSDGRTAWAIGYDSTEGATRIAEDAHAWAVGDWEPNEADGQIELSLDEYQQIADGDSQHRDYSTGERITR